MHSGHDSLPRGVKPKWQLALLLGALLGAALTGYCRAESAWSSVSVLESRSWLLTLPWPSPTLRTIGAGGGTWRSLESLTAAQAATSAALLQARGVLVQFKRTSINTGLENHLEQETQLTPSGHASEPFIGCEAMMWEAAYNLTWCVGSADPSEHEPGENGPAWPPMPQDWLQPNAEQRPAWLESVPVVPGWRTGVGAAGRTVRPSSQFPLAEKRGLAALAEQVEVHLRSGIAHGGPEEAAAKHSMASATVFLEDARTVSVWRNADGSLYVLVAARTRERGPMLQ